VFISSLSAIATIRGSTIYAATKRAIEALTDGLRLEMLAFGVSVTSVLPGYVVTPLSDKINLNFKDIVPEETYKPYESFFETYVSTKKEGINFKDAPGPDVTTEVIIHALTDPYPYTRYYVGSIGSIPVKAVPLMYHFFPDRVGDLFKINRI